METAHAVNCRSHGWYMDYQEDPYREARLAVAISSLEVPSICDSADRSPTLSGSRDAAVTKHLLSTNIAC